MTKAATADSRRMKDSIEALNKVQSEMAQRYDPRFHNLESELREIKKLIIDLKANGNKVDNMEKSPRPPGFDDERESQPPNWGENVDFGHSVRVNHHFGEENTGYRFNTRLTRIEFPRFNGVNGEIVDKSPRLNENNGEKESTADAKESILEQPSILKNEETIETKMLASSSIPNNQESGQNKLLLPRTSDLINCMGFDEIGVKDVQCSNFVAKIHVLYGFSLGTDCIRFGNEGIVKSQCDDCGVQLVVLCEEICLKKYRVFYVSFDPGGGIEGKGNEGSVDDLVTTFDVHAAITGSNATTSFFGVNNGHGDKVVAKFCAKFIHQQVLKNEAYEAVDIQISVRKAFLRMVDMICGQRGWWQLIALGDRINKVTSIIESLIWSPRGSDNNEQPHDLLRVGACLGKSYNEVWCAAEYYKADSQIMNHLFRYQISFLESEQHGRNLLDNNASLLHFLVDMREVDVDNG